MIGKGVGPGGREPCPLLVKMKTVSRRMAKPAIISSKIMLHNQNGSKHDEYKETQIFFVSPVPRNPVFPYDHGYATCVYIHTLVSECLEVQVFFFSTFKKYILFIKILK